MGPLLPWHGTAHHVVDPWVVNEEDSLQIQGSCRYISSLGQNERMVLQLERLTSQTQTNFLAFKV
jgi:hypothetical protein